MAAKDRVALEFEILTAKGEKALESLQKDVRSLVAEMEKTTAGDGAIGELTDQAAQAERELDSLRAKLAQLREQSDAASALQNLGKAVEVTADKLAKAREKAEALGKQFAATDEPTKRLTGQFEKARAAVNKLEAEWQEQQATLQKARKEFQELTGSSLSVEQVQRKLALEAKQVSAAFDAQAANAGELAQRFREAAAESARVAEAERQAAAEAKRAADDIAAGAALSQKMARQAAEAVAEEEAAFRALGVVAESELRRMADEARNAFEVIERSGSATTDQLQAAAASYAESLRKAYGANVAESERARLAAYGVGNAFWDAGKRGAAGISSLDNAFGAVLSGARASVAGAERLLTGLAGKVTAVGAAIAAAFGAQQLAQWLGSGISQAADLEDELNKLRVSTNATAEEMTQLEQAVAAATEADARTDDIAKGLAAVRETGRGAAESAILFEQSARLADATGGDLAKTVTGLDTVLRQQEIAAADSAGAVDLLAAAGARSSGGLEGLLATLAKVGPAAQASGIDLQQLTTLIVSFEKAGLKGEQTTSVLNAVLGKLSNPASAASKALRDLGISTKDPIEALLQLGTRSGPKAEAAIAAFGDEAGPKLKSFLAQGGGALRGFQEDLANTSGAADRMAAEMDRSWSEQWGGFLAQLDEVGRAIGKPILEPLKAVLADLKIRIGELSADGTLTQFGKTVADAFRTAGDAVLTFIKNFDFAEAQAKFQAFVTWAQQNADLAVKVFTGAVGGIRIFFNGITAGVSLVLATFTTALSGMTSAWARMAELIGANDLAQKLRETSAAMGEATKALVAQIVQDGTDINNTYDGMTGAIERTASSYTAAGQAASASAQQQQAAASATQTVVAQMAEKVKEARTEIEAAQKKLTEMITSGADPKAIEQQRSILDGLIEKYKAVGTAAGLSRAEIEKPINAAHLAEAQANVARLRQEYEDLRKGGASFDELRAKLEELDKETAKVTGLTRQLGDEFENLKHRVEKAGIQTTAALKEAAAEAKKLFDDMRADGSYTASDLAQAWQQWKEKAVASGDQVQINMADYWEIAYKATDQMDQLGAAGERAGVKTAEAFDAAGDSIEKAGDKAAGAAKDLKKAADSSGGWSKNTDGDVVRADGGQLPDDLIARLGVGTHLYKGGFLFIGQKEYEAALERIKAKAAEAEEAAKALAGTDVSRLNGDLESAADSAERIEKATKGSAGGLAGGSGAQPAGVARPGATAYADAGLTAAAGDLGLAAESVRSGSEGSAAALGRAADELTGAARSIAGAASTGADPVGAGGTSTRGGAGLDVRAVEHLGEIIGGRVTAAIERGLRSMPATVNIQLTALNPERLAKDLQPHIDRLERLRR